MPWPTQLDYQDALNAPDRCFADPDLARSATVEQSPFGLPQPITGHFANVYHLRAGYPLAGGGDGEWAVRLFLQADPDRPAHWQALTDHFAPVPLPEVLVPFVYQARGIWIRGAWYPLVKMPWVVGVDIHTYLENNLNDLAGTARLAEKWRRAVLCLKAENFVHGDIQHGNLLVESGTGSIRLIDYDASLVPGRFGLPLPERGHPSYQHPLVLKQKTLVGGPFLDRFPALVVYTVLRVLAVAPELWYRLDNSENLLFRREDFADPANSRAFSLLASALVKRPAERRLVDLLRAAVAQPLPQIPTADLWPTLAV